MKSRFLFSLFIPVIALAILAGYTTAKPENTITANNENKDGSAIEFTDANFESKALKSNKLTVVDFWATWCGPCRRVGPIVEELAKEYKGKVNIGKLDVDKNTNITIEYGITSIPTLLFIKNGKVVDKLIGGYPKSTIEKKIKALM